MRILYLINHAGKAGTEKYIYNLVKRFGGKETECYFAFNEPGLLSEQMDDLGVPCFQLEMKNPFDLGAAKKLAAICKANHIDIIHSHYPRENYIAVLSRLFYPRAKALYTCHLTLKTGALWWFTNKLITPHNAKIIAVCNNAKELLVSNGVNPGKIDVIFNGIPYDDKPNAPSTIREELGLAPDTFVISILARYHMSKGLDFLVDSIAALDKKIERDYVLLIAGDGEYFEDIKAQIARLGLEKHIRQLGFRSDTENILAGSDVYVNSSKCYEALSFAILEAMAHSLPLVVTAAGGNGDIVNSTTDCGFIVPYGDTEAFADALNTLSRDQALRRRFAANAKKATETTFNLEKVLLQTLDEYKRIAGET
ncbi:MAG: glycosyltransferase family 4 protein [bacterium]|nr:glycosyltransferase family 4 protein [bacterium]